MTEWTWWLFRNNCWLALAGVLLILVLSGCGRESKEPSVETPRSIRVFVVEEKFPGRVIRFPAIVKPTVTADLAFAVGGTVESIEADLGDAVEAGQTLAVLDREPYQLTADSRRGELEQARAVLRERERAFERQRNLFEKNTISASQFDRAQASYETAQADVKVAERLLRLAQRDLRETVLNAPYAGSVVARLAEEHEEVGAGRPVFQMQVKRGAEVSLLAPETLVSEIKAGDRVKVDIPARELTDIPGRVIEIGRSSIAANAFPVTIALESEDEVWDGMTAEVAFTFEPKEGNDGLLVPVSALRAESADQAVVFVFDPKSSTVQRAEVEVGGIHGDRVAILRGIEPGQRIVTTGVAFLGDGETVRLDDSGRDRP